jgi:hypothetical protein
MSSLPRIGRGAAIVTPNGTISLLVIGDVVMVWRGASEIRHDVPNHGTSMGDLALRDSFAVGWGQFPDDAEVVYLYDKADGCFGYAVNLDWTDGSEWGYAPFAETESPVQ